MQVPASAVIISGPPGIGKSDLGMALAAAMLCERSLGQKPACGECPACHWFSQSNHPDFRLLSPLLDDTKAEGGKARGEAAYEIKIAQIRELSEFVTTGAHRGGKRIVLLDPADVMNAISANALLKTLEEPTPNMHFVLVSARADRLPATVRSRCLRFSVRAPSSSTILEWLTTVAGNGVSQSSGSGRGTTPAELALRAAGGSPSAARRLLEPGQLAVYETMVAQLASLPHAGVLQVADRLSALEPRLWFDALRRWTLDLALVCSGNRARSFLEHTARLEKLCRLSNLGRIAAVSQRLDRQSAMLSRPLNARLLCETILFEYLGAFDH